MYKLSKPLFPELPVRMVIRLADEVHIPFDPDNTDYQAYLKWIADGNTPEAAE